MKFFKYLVLSLLFFTPLSMAQQQYQKNNWDTREVNPSQTVTVDEAFTFNNANDLFAISFYKHHCSEAVLTFVVSNIIPVKQAYKAVSYAYITIDNSYTSMVSLRVEHSTNSPLTLLMVNNYFNGSDSIISHIASGKSFQLHIIMQDGKSLVKTFELNNANKSVKEAILMCSSTNT